MNKFSTYKLHDWIDVDKLNWDYLQKNPHALHILEQNLDKLNWVRLSSNPNAIHIIEKNLDKVKMKDLTINPNIFKPVYDYKAIKLHFESLHKELATLFYHPLRMNPEYIMLFDNDDIEYDKQFDKPVMSVLKKQRVM